MKTIRYKIIKYLIPFIGIPNFSYCAFSIYFMVNDKEKYTTINTPSGVNKYEYIKKYETANNCIENNTIPDADTLDIKTLFTTGFVSYNGSHNRNHPEFSYIKYDNIDDLIFLYFKFQPSSYPIKITDTLQITNFKKTIGSHAGIIIYAITKNTLNHLKKLQITHIRINGGKYTLDKPIKIFSNEQDVIETLKEGIPTGEIINDRYKTTAIKDFVLKQDPDLWIDERTKYNISLNSKDTETIGEDNLYETEDTDLCFNIFPNYGVELEYEYKLPPNTSLRKISEYGTDGEDGFGEHNCTLPQKAHIEFKTKTHQITNEELLKPIEDDEAEENKKKYTI